jgi:hypothetical protein
MVRRVSKKAWSEGHVFYCCPARKVKLMFLVCIFQFKWLSCY